MQNDIERKSSCDWEVRELGEVTERECRVCGRIEHEFDYDYINAVSFSYGYESAPGKRGIETIIINSGTGCLGT